MIFSKLFLLFGLFFSVASLDESFFLSLPIRLNNPDGSGSEVRLSFSAFEKRLEFVVADFCELNNIR
jgi:hypothetical protein